MNKLFFKLAITAAAGSLLSSNPMVAQESPTTQKAAHIEITQGPEIEIAKEFLTIIRWTTNNPGGSPVHYGIVRYGTDPKNLGQTAKSPLRLDPSHPTTIFRVRMVGLKAGTTYYYTVGAEGSDGSVDKMESAVKQFTVPVEPQQSGAQQQPYPQQPGPKAANDGHSWSFPMAGCFSFTLIGSVQIVGREMHGFPSSTELPVDQLLQLYYS